ncbi:MAG: protein translocase subunit SecF [Planctomycetes bacterium]|nr:protein translocase subunit SecF [Planctomycetota bacterium]
MGVIIVFSLETVKDSLSSEIEKLTKDDQADTLFKPQGTGGSGLNNSKQPRYDKVQLQVKPELSEANLKKALDSLQETMAVNPLFEEVSTFDSSVAEEMRNKAILAMLASLVAIVAYIWFRFQQITFGLAAVVALVHDVLVVLGMVALASYGATELGITALGLQEFKINLPMIAAFLTIVGYSLNDTIVVFDRIREVRGKNPAMTDAIVNTSLNQTLSRTLLTSMTTFFVVVILYALGGEGIHGFAFCLVLGVIVGTYSSIYVASPVLIWLMNRPGSAAAKATAAPSR